MQQYRAFKTKGGFVVKIKGFLRMLSEDLQTFTRLDLASSELTFWEIRNALDGIDSVLLSLDADKIVSDNRTKVRLSWSQVFGCIDGKTNWLNDAYYLGALDRKGDLVASITNRYAYFPACLYSADITIDLAMLSLGMESKLFQYSYL